MNTVISEIAMMAIDDQLKMIREENHQEYLLNIDHKSPSLENTKNNASTKQFSGSKARKENINKKEETNRGSYWLSGTCAKVRDSMVNGIGEKKLQKRVKVFYFSGARINDMNHYLILIIAKQTNCLIVQVGTNGGKTNTFRKIIVDLLTQKCNISKQLRNCRVVVSKPTIKIWKNKSIEHVKQV